MSGPRTALSDRPITTTSSISNFDAFLETEYLQSDTACRCRSRYKSGLRDPQAV